MRSTLLLLLAAALVACGEPEPDLTLPDRPEGEHVLDEAGVLDKGQLHDRLSQLSSDGLDIIALTFETDQAGCGEAFRAAGLFVQRWSADIAVVAVAKPGDFTSTEDSRVRCLGVQPRDTRAVPADVREEIAEELVPPLAAENDWTGAFTVAIDRLAVQ
jgi:hypothetical protein